MKKENTQRMYLFIDDDMPSFYVSDFVKPILG